MAMRRRFRPEPRGPQIRINHRIRVPEVLVVAEDGSNLGVISTQDALRRAKEAGLDLVEINPKGNPPVCKILDFGKFKYEEAKKKRETKRKQSNVEVKEIKLRPKTDEHDMAVKLRALRKFVLNGNKVKVVCRFRGREIAHPEMARGQLEELIKNSEDICTVELMPTMEGRTMAILVAPKPVILQRVAQERARRESERARERMNEREREIAEKAARRLRQEQAEADRAAHVKTVDELLQEADAEDEDYEDDDDDFDDDEDGDEDLDDEDEDDEEDGEGDEEEAPKGR